MVTLYDFATSAVVLVIALMLFSGLYLLMKATMKPLAFILWLIAILCLPILGPLTFILYLRYYPPAEPQTPGV